MANFFCRSRPTVQWAALTNYALGDRRIALATVPGLGIHFEVTTDAGSSGAAEPAWDTTVGNTTVDGGLTWTTRGSAADRVASTAYALGDRVVATTAESAAEQSLCFECTTAGTTGAGATISFNTTIGGTTTDNTVVWTTRAPTTWNNAHIRLQGLLNNNTNGMTAGDTVWVSHTHLQTSAAAVSLTPVSGVGSRTNPIKIICVNDVGDPASPTTLATTATITTTGASSISWQGSQSTAKYVYGIVHNCGTGATAADITVQGPSLGATTMEACAFNLVTTSTTSDFIADGVTSVSTHVKLINCTISFAATGQGITIDSCSFEWINNGTGPATSGSIPAVLFEDFTGVGSVIKLSGLDLSHCTGALFNAAETLGSIVHMSNCKLHASATLMTGTPVGLTAPITMINCDSGATNSNVQYVRSEGTLTDELTIVRTGGASDGTTPFSQKIVTVATLPRFEFPFISLPIGQWNNTTGSAKTLTVEIVNDGVTLTDGDVWVEVEYLGTAGFPIASFIDDAKSDLLATAANQASSSVTWTTTGLTTPIKQALSVTFTPQLKGPVIARVCVARPSTTLYVDPIATIT